jgi:hypothetical protein
VSQVSPFDQRCDKRGTFNTLSALVQQDLKPDLLEGDLFLVRG